ncbi:Putative cobalamin-independent methionine synthase MetE/archaeal, UROD/MetE-like superfamily [Septoria linicola]|uniref:Cobalamin-independent methionine synthase MetE/archaeal, UROD/MetE-like superfamily n=1 Tax=Septoria linicola TaxID=215465 RepID=A0A9Q9AQ46_9PEZI|nr:putative cobalamin-independent methionine synthase MetE/archaeal, UROD/MetE-like superfamily [Septoria linicola]USW50022.1 Putative cobalamin-independent methionine synthase MetE/archaeal, UROD/MetE-like superfamily [Septoria linicola]
MPVTKLPFHADHIGSLIRPSSVSEAQEKADVGQISQEELRKVQQKEIADIVKKQQDNNVRALCSGEFDRKYYFSGFFEKLDGFKEVSPVPWELARLSAAPIAALKKAGKQYPMAAICTGKIKYTKSPYLENWKLLRETLPKEQWKEAKFTMPPPCYFHLRLAPGKCYDTKVYGNDTEFFEDLAAAYRQEFKTLYDEGLRNIQIDDPTLAYFCSEDMLKGLREDGEDTDKLFELYLKAHNDCIADRPDDLHVGLHICRGNFSKSMHFSEGSYEVIAEQFFKTLNYDTFYLEYDNIRSGGFEPLRFLPKHKNVVLGVVTTKDPQLEDRELIKRRVLEAAEIIAKGQGRTTKEALENIGMSPQCGFASVAIGAEGMDEQKMFAKLKLVQDVAKELWPDRP